MANLSPISTINELAGLYLILHHAIQNFPKLEKFGLGKTIEITLFNCINNCFLSTCLPVGEKKIIAIANTSASFDSLKIYIRLAVKLYCLDEKIYLKIFPRLSTIGSMLGGWMKEAKKNAGR